MFLLFRKTKIFVAALILFLNTGVVPTYATPTGYVKKEQQKKEYQTIDFQSLSAQNDTNKTGLIRKTDSEQARLKQNITDVTPYLEDMLKSVYQKAEAQVETDAKEHGWDIEYTLQNFHDYGNPYDEIDYNDLIAAYATIVDNGRNGHELLSDVPFIRMEYAEKILEDGAKYADVTLKILDIDGLFRFYGYDPNDPEIKQAYLKRKDKIRDALTGSDIRQQMFVQTPQSMLTPEVETARQFAKNYYFPSEIQNHGRQNVIRAAFSLLGKVPYQWGGKPSHPGYDNSWWSFLPNGKQKGLDCSGFVQWCFMTAGYGRDVTDKILSTYDIRRNLEDITRTELMPGDIGLMKNDSQGTNHTGIYLGDGKWIHCSSSGKGVVINNFNFRFFKRAPEGSWSSYIAEESIRNSENAGIQALQSTDQDVYTLAQLLEHEVGGEGYNAWVAVAEVVRNRVMSSLFPDTLQEVVWQPGEFSYVSEIRTIHPRQEVINVAESVLNGSLTYFNDPDVLFFRNPTITNGIAAEDPIDWGRYKWTSSVGRTAFYLCREGNHSRIPITMQEEAEQKSEEITETQAEDKASKETRSAENTSANPVSIIITEDSQQTGSGS